MTANYRLPPEIFSRTVAIDVVGCGGTGSQLLTGLARLDRCLRSLGHPGLQVTAYDPDRVSEANVGRQLFAPGDIGLAKSDVLIHRLNMWFGLGWASMPKRYEGKLPYGPLVIGCVDSARSRVEIHEHAARAGRLLWLDCGNDDYTGQVVFGEVDHKRKRTLPNVLDMFPEMRDPAFQAATREEPSCSLAESLDRQSAFINQAIATQALSALWLAFRTGGIERFAWFINLRDGQTTSLKADRATCKRYFTAAQAA